jgi:hypothetical protein
MRSLLVPMVVGLPPLFWIVDATRRASLTPLGRDQGIFQYIAWAIGRGAVDYRDVRDVNGPLTHLIHLVLLALGGADEHRFRILDLAVTGLSFAVVGACAPGLRSSRAPSPLERAGWAFAGWVVLSGQYLLYDYWHSAQRESFFDWFLLPSLSLQLVAQAPWLGRAEGRPRRIKLALLAVAGALSVVPWFGKPTYVLFTAAQLLAIAAGAPRPTDPSGRRGGLLLSSPSVAWLTAFAVGGALGAASQMSFVLARGDALAYARIQLVDVPAMYRFIWPRAMAELLSDPWRATQAIFALAGAATFLALLALRELPPRVIAVALAPVCAIVHVVVQAKGFPYHFHPVTASIHLQWLLLVAWAAERARVAQRRFAAVRLLPVAAAALLALRVATDMEESPYVRATWLLWGAATPAARSTRAYFAHFPEPDFFPFELHQTADYLRAHTKPEDRVQTYGMDPYVLFLAERQSATPYIYAYDLNVDAALAGGTGGHPDSAQVKSIRAMRDAHEADMMLRLEAAPPAAFVFIDGSPLLSVSDAWDDFEAHCPRSAPWVRARYRQASRFGHNHVWLRADLAQSEPPAPPERAPFDTDSAE